MSKAGRKPFPEEERRVTMCIRISPSARKMAMELKEAGYYIGRIAEQAIEEQYCAILKKDLQNRK